MKAFVITLHDHEYSNRVADRCIKSASSVGQDVHKFQAVDKEQAESAMEQFGLVWTWANDNTSTAVCPNTGLRQHPYATNDLRAIKGCFMSHFFLWKKCAEINEPILVLEHDVVFLRSLPEIEFDGICMINDPTGATRKGKWWSDQMKGREPGVYPKTMVTTEKDRDIPDGLAGNSAYMIKPKAAQELIETCRRVGVWPNDAIMCQQLFPYLQEYYPFIVSVQQTQSTSTNRK